MAGSQLASWYTPPTMVALVIPSTTWADKMKAMKALPDTSISVRATVASITPRVRTWGHRTYKADRGVFTGDACLLCPGTHVCDRSRVARCCKV